MATALYLDTLSTFNSGSQYAILQNPMQPRGMVKNQPAQAFETLSGAGGVQAPADWFPLLTLTWPALVKSNTDHAALVAAFEARQHVKTGADYFLGILPAASKDDGYPFWNAAKYIKIRIIEVRTAENPIDTDLSEVIFDLVVTCKWVDAS